MQGLQKVAFLGLVCFFGSASVFVAGTDMHRRLSRYTDEERQAAQRLIEQLRGETLSPNPGGAVQAGSIPPRSAGSALSDHDKSRIKKFLGGVFSSEPAKPVPEQDPAQDEAPHVPSEVVAEESVE